MTKIEPMQPIYLGDEEAKHPMQPLYLDGMGTVRFKMNRIVRYLKDHGGIDLDMLARIAHREEFSEDDYTQFMQLIGYSVSGFCDMDVSEDMKDQAWDLAQTIINPPDDNPLNGVRIDD